MVQQQLVPRGISDERVLSAMRTVPRHVFVGQEQQEGAYDDRALPIGESQTISQPYMVAKMTELLELTGTERVLEIGTGSGYQTAILAELASVVFTIERFSLLSAHAREAVESLGYKNVRFVVGDGTQGLSTEAPFDRVLITAGAPRIPEALAGQMTLNGIMVIPVGDRTSQTLIRARNTPQGLSEDLHTSCIFVPLVGEQGWPDE